MGERQGETNSRTRRGRLLLLVFAVVPLALLFAARADAAPYAATASVLPQATYLNDSAGTLFMFTVTNTGTSTSIGAVEIARPSGDWTVTGCPVAPIGWTAQTATTKCRYRSAKAPNDDIKPGQSSSLFGVRATTAPGSADRLGTWSVTVSKTNGFETPSALIGAPAPTPGALTTTAHSFQVLDAGIAAGPAAAGSACPTLSHEAITGSTQNIVVCGRNRTTVTLTPNSSNSSLGGTWIATPGTFSSGAVAPTTTSRVLGTWTGAHVTTTFGPGKTVVAKIGSATNRTSPLTTLNGYDAKNRPPVAAATSATALEDGSTPVTLSATDDDGDAITFSIATSPAHGALGAIGAVTCSGATPNSCSASVTYTPSPDYFGGDSFTYKANDGHGDSATAATATLTVTGVNDPPVANDDSPSVSEDSTGDSVAVRANDTDVDNDTLSVTAVDTTGTTGSVTNNGTDVTYDPNGQFEYLGAGDSDTDTFTYTVSDGNGGTDTATVTVTVTGVNDNPVAVDDAKSTDEGTPALVNVLANDTDAEGAVTVTSVDTTGTSGTVTDHGDGTVTYDPNGQFEALGAGDSDTDTFTYTITDAQGATDTATVTVKVNGVNDAPVAVDDSRSVSEDSTGATVSVLANDTDAEGQTLTVTAVDTTGTTGSVTNNGTDVTYDPNGQFEALGAGDTDTDTFTYTVSDGNGGTDTATVTVTITGVNDAPVAVDDAYQTLQDTPLVVLTPGVLANDTDADGDTLTVPIAGTVSHGDLNINTDGSFTYTPASGYTGPDSFTYVASDGDLSDQATVSITVVAPNAAPTADATSASGNEDGGAINVVLSGDDADGDPLTFTAGTATKGLVTVPGTPTCTNAVPNHCSVTVSYTPNANEFGPDSFTYTVNDGTVDSSSATASITVNSVNDVPSFTKGSNQTLLEDDGPQSVSNWASAISKGPANESDQVLHFTVSNNNNALFTTLGQPAVSPTGTLTYTSAPNANGAATVTLSLADNGGTDNGGVDTSANQQFTITVTAVNDTPDAVNDSQTTNEDTFQNISVLANDSDVDLDTLTIQSIDTTGTLGAVTNNGNGTIKFNPAGFYDAMQVGDPDRTTTFTYTINDGHGLTDTATVTVTITPVNDAPVAANESQTNLIGNTLHVVSTTSSSPHTTGTGNLKDGVTDPDDTIFTVTAGASSTNLGTVAVNSDGTYTFLPKAGYTGTDTFTFTVHDANGGTDDATASMTVANMVWYVNSAAGAGDGRSSSPYNALAGINGAGGSGDADAVNDVIFLYQGSYSGGLPLEAGQKLWGQPQGLNVASVQLVNAGGSNPTVAGGVALGSNTDVQGVTLGTAASFALSGTSVGSSTVGTTTAVDINNTGGGGINLNTGSPTVTLSKMVATGGTNGLVLTNLGGTVTVNDTTSAISGTSATALGVSGGAGSLTYKGTVTTGAGAHSVSISNHTAGTIDLQGDITDSGTGISLSTNTGTVISMGGKLTLNTGSNAAFSATGGGTVTAPNTANTSTSTTGTGVNIANTTIGAAGVKFKSVAVDGAPSGIALNTTGSSGSFSVLGTGTQPSGGLITNTTGHGIDLTNTLSPVFNNVKVLNTAGQGVKGSSLTNFTFTNGWVENSGTGGASDASNIGLNTSGSGTEQNVTGAVNISGNTLKTARYHGVDVINYNGTISDLAVSGNTITSAASTITSLGSGIRVTAFGNASTVGAVTKAEIQNNTITNFPMGAGIAVQGGNSNGGGPAATVGVNGSGTNVISITGNHVAGDPTLEIATQAILVTTNGKGQGNFDVSNNGTVGDALRYTKGATIAGSVLGNTTATMVFNNNVIQAHNVFASPGIGVGTSSTFGVSDTPNATVTITNNNVSATEGQGILVTARDANGTLRAKVQNNTVAAPTAGVRQGIRVDSGNGTAGEHETVCLNITGNTSAGSTGPAMGIGIRRDSLGTDVFGINGMAAVTASPGVEAYVSANNPTGGGTLLLSATTGFSNCSLP